MFEAGLTKKRQQGQESKTKTRAFYEAQIFAI